MGFFTKERPMSFKDHKRGLKQVQDQALENSRHLFANHKLHGKTYNPGGTGRSSRAGRPTTPNKDKQET
jgi:hypothetical protein